MSESIYELLINENKSDKNTLGPKVLPSSWSGVKKYLGLNPLWVKDNPGKFPQLKRFSEIIKEINNSDYGEDLEEYITPIYNLLGFVNKKRCCILIDNDVLTFFLEIPIFTDFIHYILQNYNICLFLKKYNPETDKEIFTKICSKEDIITNLTEKNWKEYNLFLIQENILPKDVKLPYNKVSKDIYDFINNFTITNDIEDYSTLTEEQVIDIEKKLNVAYSLFYKKQTGGRKHKKRNKKSKKRKTTTKKKKHTRKQNKTRKNKKKS